MASVYVKTEAGSAEIRERKHALSRPARTLLLLADGSRGADQLLTMVQGSAATDMTMLVEAGLLLESGARSPDASAPAPAAAPAPVAEPVSADGPLDYAELYESVNALAKEQLGLFKGYRFILEIEKASGIEELREVAHRLVDEVQKAKGDSAAQMVRRALGLKR